MAIEIEERLNKIGYQRLHHIQCDHRPPGYDLLPEEHLSKWFFASREPAINLHVRVQNTSISDMPFCCGDYLKAQPYAAKVYEEIKKQLANYFPSDMDAYYDIKDPVFIMSVAALWSEKIGWKPEMTE